MAVAVELEAKGPQRFLPMAVAVVGVLPVLAFAQPQLLAQPNADAELHVLLSNVLIYLLFPSSPAEIQEETYGRWEQS